MVGFRQAGWVRLAPVVNRAKYIGKHGIHMNKSYWNKMGFEEINLDLFPTDDTILDFEVQYVRST